MKSRTFVAATSVAVVLWCVPSPTSADGIPSKPQNPTHEAYIGESDPWVPDGRDPGRALASPPRLSVATDDRSGAITSPKLIERLWLRTMVRMLRTFGLGGALR